MKSKRNFTTQEKLALLKEVSEHGVIATLKKHGIYSATYYSWRQKFNEMGEEGTNT